MWSPEELGEDAGPEHPTRRDDVPGRAHQKIRELRPRRRCATTARTDRWPERREPVAGGRTAPRAREIARARRKNRDGSPGLRPGSGAPPRAAPRAPPW